MPELPEVETVRKGLSAIFKRHPVIEKVRLMRADIRFPIPPDLSRKLAQQKIIGVRRRAKYLLIDTPRFILLSHLGMSGSWRLLKQNEIPGKHDHCLIDLSDGKRNVCLAYRDPRRFGVLDVIEMGRENESLRLKNLGPEPLDEIMFTGKSFFEKSRNRKVAAKVFLMNQQVVVGIGNIYASEVLFRARVRPAKLAGKLTQDECDRIVVSTREILQKAIQMGGSSIRDYRQADGEEGGFQSAHFVYDRAGSECLNCKTIVKAKVMGGRSTFWCPTCQN